MQLPHASLPLRFVVDMTSAGAKCVSAVFIGIQFLSGLVTTRVLSEMPFHKMLTLLNEVTRYRDIRKLLEMMQCMDISL